MVIVDYSMDCNIPKHLANNMITSFSLGDLVGRLGSGAILFFIQAHFQAPIGDLNFLIKKNQKT